MTAKQLLPILIYGCLYTPANADVPFKIDEAHAQRLVVEGEYGTLIEESGVDDNLKFFFHAVDFEKMTKPFFVFGGESAAGLYAVNPWTGDVWDFYSCVKIDSPLSKKDRKQIRQTFTPQELKRYDKLAAIKPACINN